MAWLLLAVAIATEVIGTIALKLSDGMTHVGWTIIMAIGYVASVIVLARALKLDLPVGVAYAIWAGTGTAGIAIAGTALFGEPMNLIKAAGIVLIIAGVAVLNLSGAQ
ncbi:multidrug efflux SMR transporter [Streptosporangiaceae bacterium NEAU-GS5]|nr:multidrug efflux SMR transporter [Streptosporangiaceae bacterium NEAU-GS5]